MAVIELNNVSVEFPIYDMSSRSFKRQFLRLATGGNVGLDLKNKVIISALKNINLMLSDGDRVGVIGHNGAGKSTLLRLLARIYEPSSGRLHIQGNVSPLLDLMQGIELELTGNENIITRGLLLGLNYKRIIQHLPRIAEFTELGDYLYMPVRTYSSGMIVRLAFAISTNFNPDILLIDEVFGAGDASFMTKARNRIADLIEQSNILVIAIHSNEILREFCNKTLLLKGGEIEFFGSVEEGLSIYQSLT